MLITDEHIETYAMIDHGNGLTTLYGHCSQLLARVGQTVQAGDIIALAGSKGKIDYEYCNKTDHAGA